MNYPLVMVYLIWRDIRCRISHKWSKIEGRMLSPKGEVFYVCHRCGAASVDGKPRGSWPTSHIVS